MELVQWWLSYHPEFSLLSSSFSRYYSVLGNMHGGDRHSRDELGESKSGLGQNNHSICQDHYQIFSPGHWKNKIGPIYTDLRVSDSHRLSAFFSISGLLFCITPQRLLTALEQTLAHFVAMATHRAVQGKQICNINDIDTNKRNWKVLIQVVQRKKGGVTKDPKNPSRYRGYLFIDTVGTFVSAVCHGTDVAFFETTLLPGKRYYVQDAHVKAVKAGYEVGSYPYYWTLYNTTFVYPVEESVPPMLPYDFEFKKLSEMFRYADRETQLNIAGLVIGTFPEKKVGVDKQGRDIIAKDFIVVDTEKIPMIMRLWKDKLNEYADVLSEGLPEPIFFVAMNVKVTTFNTLSLTSVPNSVFLKNALVRQSSELEEWYLLNKQEVDQFVPMKVYTDTNRLLQKPSKKDIIHIGVVMANLETTKTAWIQGKLRLIPGQERFWYRACKHCHTSLGHRHVDNQPCPTCDMPDPVAYTCHAAVTITDTSETAHVEIYSPNLEQLIPFTAEALKQAEDQGQSIINQVEAALENKHVVAYIKYFDKWVRGTMVRKFPLAKIYLYDDVFPPAQPPNKQPANETSSSDFIDVDQVVDLSKDEEDDTQLFTPSMKNVIDKILVASQPAVESSSKRALFVEDAPKATATVKIEPADEPVIQTPPAEPSNNQESPIKKAKTKNKKD